MTEKKEDFNNEKGKNEVNKDEERNYTKNLKQDRDVEKKTKETDNKKTVKKRGGRFKKISTNLLISPSGIFLIILAFIIEMIDLIPIPGISILSIPFEVVFMIMLYVITGMSLKDMAIPFLIERIPILSSIIPTWLIRLFM